MGAQHESGNGAASVEAREDEFLGNFELLDDTLLQFEYILSFIGDLNAISEEDRTDDCKVEGCASNAWLMLEARNGRLKLSLGSDSLIIEGLLGAHGCSIRSPSKTLPHGSRAFSNIRR